MRESEAKRGKVRKIRDPETYKGGRRTNADRGHPAPRVTLGGRVRPENKAWAEDRAEGIGISVGEYIDRLIERERIEALIV